MDSPDLYARRYNASDILSLSWKTTKNNLPLLLGIILSIYLPVNILVALIPENILATDAFVPGFKVYAIIVSAVQMLIVLIADLALIYAVREIVEGRKANYRTSFAGSLKKWPTAVGTQIIMAVFLAGLFLLLILPGILFAVYWSFATFAVVLRDKSGTSALSYSKSLVKGRWWKVLGYSVSFSLLSLLPVIPLFLLMYFADLYIPQSPLYNVIYLICETGINVATSFYTVAWTIYFLNLDKARDEAKPPTDPTQREPVINRL